MSGYNDNEEVEIACDVRHETDLAYLVFDGGRTEWVPKSQIVDYSTDEHDRITEILIPEWLAEEKGFI